MILFSNIMLDIFFQKKPNKFFVLMKLFATKTIVKFTAGLSLVITEQKLISLTLKLAVMLPTY